jgi:cell division control protein 6
LEVEDEVPKYRSVFKDETKLDLGYLPPRLPHRDSELRLLMEFFSFLLQFPAKMAQRVIITGDVGTGKTVLSQRFGADICHEVSKSETKLRYVHVNCREYRGSLFIVLHHVVSTFHPTFPKRGYSAEELLRILLQILDAENVYVILALDEFESLVEREGSEAIYKLTRLQEMMPNKPQRISLICILRDLKVIDRLDASTRSTLQSNVIVLGKYSKPQLSDILGDRVSLAFRQLAMPEETIGLIAELASSEGGNSRLGIELLWRAGKYADAEDLDMVTPECVRKAVSSIIPAVRKSDLASLSFHEKLFLLGLSRFFKDGRNAYISLSEAEKAYDVVCEEFDIQPHSHTQLWKYLHSISSMGIVETEVASTGSRGRSTLIYLSRVSAHELEKELNTFLYSSNDSQ